MSSQPQPFERFAPHRVADVQLRGGGSRRARGYWPRPSSATDDPALVVVFGSQDSMFDGVDGADSLARSLCGLLGAVVLSSTATSAEAATATVGWAADHAAELGADARLLVVAGEGDGANLVAAAALHAHDHGWPSLAGQVLIRPDSDATRMARSPGVAPATVVTAVRDPEQTLLDLARALRRVLDRPTPRRSPR